MRTRIGFIGFGEAASLISEGLLSEGKVDVRAFDVNQDHPKVGGRIREKASELNVLLSASLQELVENSDVLVSATSAKFAVSVAEDAKPFLKDNQLFVDLNAASPQVKETIAGILAGHAKFVDVAVMESVPKFNHRVPMLVSGEGAQEFEELGSEIGMDITFAGEEPGKASAVKMIRSIFMKGFTMLLIETFGASEEYGVTDSIMESIDRTLRGLPLQETAEGLITRTAAHAERRVSEMEEVIRTLEGLGVDATMSEATRKKLDLLVRLGLKDIFLDQAPQNFREVIKAIQMAQDA